MLKTSVTLICVFLLASSAMAQSTTAKRAAASLGNSLSEWADRQAALDAEIELAKAKAEIEIDKQRRLREIQQQAERKPPPPAKPRTTAPFDVEQEEAKLKARHPQWVFILNSSAFGSWLGTRAPGYQQLCKSTQSADIMNSCIDAFFNAKVVQAQ